MAIDKIQTRAADLENLEIAGTEAARMPVGTEAQRANPQVGDLRHNTDNGYLEQYTADGWASIAASPVVSSISPTAIPDTDSSFDITINGSNFSSGATVQAIGQDGSTINATSTARTSGSVLVATFDGTQFADAQEDYSIKVSNNTGLAFTYADSLAVNASPAWTTAASPTTLATVVEGDTVSGSTIQVAATDDEGATLTYSLSSGSLPTGLSVNSDGTITGTESGSGTYASGGTTFTPTLAVSDGTNSVTRTFAILKRWKDGATAATAVSSLSDLDALNHGDTGYNTRYVTFGGTETAFEIDTYTDGSGNTYYVLSPTFGAGGANALNDSVAGFGYANSGEGCYKTIAGSQTRTVNTSSYSGLTVYNTFSPNGTSFVDTVANIGGSEPQGSQSNISGAFVGGGHDPNLNSDGTTRKGYEAMQWYLHGHGNATVSSSKYTWLRNNLSEISSLTPMCCIVGDDDGQSSSYSNNWDNNTSLSGSTPACFFLRDANSVYQKTIAGYTGANEHMYLALWGSSSFEDGASDGSVTSRFGGGTYSLSNGFATSAMIVWEDYDAVVGGSSSVVFGPKYNSSTAYRNTRLPYLVR